MNEQVSKNKSAEASIITTTLALSIGYAVLRYHIVGPVPWKDFPFFILNKGLCLAAFILLTMNFALGPLKNLGASVPQSWLGARKAMGMTGFLLVMLHALMSFLLFNPVVFGKFYEDDGTLTLLAGLSMLGGVTAFVVLWGYNLAFQKRYKKAIAGRMARKPLRQFLLFNVLAFSKSWVLMPGRSAFAGSGSHKKARRDSAPLPTVSVTRSPDCRVRPS